uniref:RNA helicase n=1 Tax=Plectus sambesii TaxID=2011161 RepID=A0A914V798_9BILA
MADMAGTLRPILPNKTIREIKKNGVLHNLCELCNVAVDQRNVRVWEVHLSTKRHILSEQVYHLRKKMQFFTDQIRTGIYVGCTNPSENIIVNEIRREENSDIQPHLKTAQTAAFEIVVNADDALSVIDFNFQVEFHNTTQCTMTVTDIKLLSTENSTSFLDLGRTRTLSITAGSYGALNIRGHCNNLGLFEIPLSVRVARTGNISAYNLLIPLTFDIRNKIVEDLAPKAPYQPKARALLDEALLKRVLTEKLPVTSSKLKEELPLPSFPVPADICELAEIGYTDNSTAAHQLSDVLKRKLKKFDSILLGNVTSMASHFEKFSRLLYVEDLERIAGVRDYDMESVKLHKVAQNLSNDHRQIYEIREVVGLSEGRPSVLRSDFIFAKPAIADCNTEYQGVVHRVKLNTLHVSFAPQFEQSEWTNGDQKFRVRFTVKRTSIRLQHRAVQLVRDHNMKEIVFPGNDPMDNPCFNITQFTLFDSKLAQNPEQLQAVMKIVQGQHRPAPYVLFGPPGTGKTSTLVEAVKQTLKLSKTARLLLCAPSNTAVDILAQRLLQDVPKEQMFRLYPLTRSKVAVPKELWEISCFDTSENPSSIFAVPSKQTFSQYKIILTTLASAGRLVSGGFQASFFTHLFIDEAGQATEPEILIPIGCFLEQCDDPPNIVLSGDPRQLGPVVQSLLAAECKLGQSMIERLMKDMPVYKRRLSGETTTNPQYDSNFVTKLLRNYRSHPDIFTVSSQLFYQNELIPCAGETERTSLCQWKELPKRGVPLIFRGVIGADKREEKSPSFFNAYEVAVAKGYVDKLLGQRLAKATDIGIIAPYRKQIEKFREIFRRKSDYEGIRVGSVEEFQGAECRIIIITTVRSCSKFLPIDFEFNLGFISNPK